MAGLRLAAVDFAGPDRWRWALTDAAGTLIADHEMRLDATCWQYEAFTDLLGYLSWHATPDQRAQDEARIVAELGAWIGTEVLGPVTAAVAGAAPATVRVLLPPDAAWLAFRPLELAYAGGKPLAAQDVTLVMDTSTGTGRKAPMGDRLRVLGLFSLPEGGRPLSLRRERQALVRLMERIAASGKAADVRVLQYGVTRDRLRGILEEPEGWDIIHISGHGAPGELLLETVAGMPDRVTATELADLLGLARERVALVTLSACWSASLTAAQQRRLLGLPVPAEDIQGPQAGRSRSSGPAAADSGTLATALAGHLNCAVLAMRYPVDDEFAIALSEKLYELLAGKAQPLPRAVGLALRHLARDYPALLVATPALFGARAINLTLAAPERTGTAPTRPGPGDPGMAGFPPQPARFVGRVGVMARASAALAARSGIPGVLLHGMPGGGKSACALELAYGHGHAFDRLVWYKAPDEGMDITGALTDFALTLERYLDGFQMAHVLASQDALTGFLPGLTQMMEQSRLLIVIDNAESMLTESGQWRDDRWGLVIDALRGHTGLGRLIVTSRRVPEAVVSSRAGIAGGTTTAGGTRSFSVPEADGGNALPAGSARLQAEPVDTLSADEALLLARELPHLRALIHGTAPGIERPAAQRLARRALNIAQGHPKLLELADGQAANPDRLAAFVEAGGQAWRAQGGLPDGFLTTGETTASAADYLHVLAAWTSAVAGTLSPGERTLFWLLCCLAESERERFVLDHIWPHLWSGLGRGGQPPRLDPALSALAAQGLAVILAETDDTAESYAVHPGVAAAGRARAGKTFQDAVDTSFAAFWAAVWQYASGVDGNGGVHTGMLVRYSLAFAPYLIRQQQWTEAGSVLEQAFISDPSRTNAAAVLPAIQQITRHDPSMADVLAKVLRVIDPAEAEAQLRAFLEAAVARDDYQPAWVAASQLTEWCHGSGQLAEALALAGQAIVYSRQADLGPWTQVADEVRRLQVLNAMGQASQVLPEVLRLRDQIRSLPARLDPDNETVPWWKAREGLLGTGRDASLLLEQWDDALALNADLISNKRDRHTSATDIAQSRFNDYAPLLRLGRTDEALALLLDCRQVFQNAHEIKGLGMTLSALADVEDDRSHGDAAIRLQRDALRYSYLAGQVNDIAAGYHNLGNYIRRHAHQPVPALASHLASALISVLTGFVGSAESADAVVTDLLQFGTDATLPADAADLCRQLDDIPGTELARLLQALSPDPVATDQALHDLIVQAQSLAATVLSGGAG